MNNKLHVMANDLIKTFKYASFGVIDENGYPSVSAVSLNNPENIAEFYFTTTMDSNKVKRLAKINKACLNCYTSDNNITLVGEADIVSDEETKKLYWDKWVELGADVYPGGVSDPNYCFVRFKTKRVSLWINNEGSEFMLDKSNNLF